MPHDVEQNLKLYLELLIKWQSSINLVSPQSLSVAKERHFDDSLQLVDYIDQNQIVFDLGSGAGFPGLVLAMARPDLDVTLIESDHKKCTFLSTVSRETKTPVNIVNQRIESVELKTVPDIITARALAPLDKLLEYAFPFVDKNESLKCLFLKGEAASGEVDQARERFSFDLESFSSSISDGRVLIIQNLGVLSET